MSRYRGVNGVAREVTKRYRGVDGVARTIVSSYRGVDGVARKFFSSEVPTLKVHLLNNRNCETATYNETDTELTAKVSGGTGTAYASVYWKPFVGSDLLLLQAGDVVKFSFTGTRDGGYCDYGIIFYDPNGSGGSAYANAVDVFFNSAYSDYEYTVTQECSIQIVCQIGGWSSSDLYATISVTDLQINGKRVWA